MKKYLGWMMLFCLLLSAPALGEMRDVFDPALYEGRLAVWFFSLPGEDHTGESILVRSPEGKYLLIDGGIPEAAPLINDYLEKIGVGRLDMVLATHMHIDHVGGLPGVMKQHPADVIYSSPFTAYQTSPVANLKASAANQGLSLTPLLAGDTFYVGAAKATVLSPFEEPVPVNENAITGDFLNDSSVVFRLEYGDISILFPGDATRMVEFDLMEIYGDQLKSTVIKVPHHGSSDASFRMFVQMVAPRESVMCIYAFNDFSVYERYEKIGNRPWVTSMDGTVLMVTDGETLAFYTEKERTGLLK